MRMEMRIKRAFFYAAETCLHLIYKVEEGGL